MENYGKQLEDGRYVLIIIKLYFPGAIIFEKNRPYILQTFVN